MYPVRTTFMASAALVSLLAPSVGAAAPSAPAPFTFHQWEIRELYSNDDGTVQFIELFSPTNNQQFTQGEVIRTRSGASFQEFVFPSDTPAPTGNRNLLLATADFASIPGSVTPDFIIPDNFLYTTDGEVDLFPDVIGSDSQSYAFMPTDGLDSLNYPGETTTANSPTNYAGTTGAIDLTPLIGDVGMISLTTGGDLTMTLNRRPSAANHFYFLFGTVSGPVPGIDFGGGVVLPLNQDLYFNLTLNKPGLGAFINFRGQLDGNGQATAVLSIPSSLSGSLAGTTMHHAYLSAEVFGFPDFASNPLPLLLVP